MVTPQREHASGRPPNTAPRREPDMHRRRPDGRSIAAHMSIDTQSTNSLIAVASWAVSFAWPLSGDGSLAMVLLSDECAAAATAAERAPLRRWH